MIFMFSTVYRVTQKDFYARPYTSLWAAAVARQISKRYSLPRVQQHVSCYKLNCSNDTLSHISQISNFSPVHNVLNKPPCKKSLMLSNPEIQGARQYDLQLIAPHMLINTWQELEYRLDICRATTGAHIEVCGHAYKSF